MMAEMGPKSPHQMLGRVVGYERKKGEVSNALNMIESLWAFGVPDDRIRAALAVFEVWKNEGRGSWDDLGRALWRDIGIDAKTVDSAEKMGKWRVNPKDSMRAKINYFIEDALGGGRDMKTAFLAEANRQRDNRLRSGGLNNRDKNVNDDDLLAAAQSLWGPNMMTQALIKIGEPDLLQDQRFKGKVPEWNPYRGDAPKKAEPYVGPAEGTPPSERYPEKPVEPDRSGIAAPKAPVAPGGGGGGGAGGGGGGGGPSLPTIPPPPMTNEEKLAYVKKNYGANAWFLDIPEVRDMLLSAAGREAPDDEVERLVKNTEWYKRTERNQRAWYVLEREEPGEAKDRIMSQVDIIKRQAGVVGVELTDDRAYSMAESYLRYGWDSNELNQAIASEFYYDPEDRKGGPTVQALQNVADEYFVPVGEEQVRTWGRDIIAGTSTEDDYRQFLADQAKSLFPHLQGPLDRGETVAKYMDQYYNLAAQTLGVNRSDISFKDQKWMRPLTMVDDKGNRQAMSLDQWQQVLRTDDSYGFDQTQTARDEAVKLAEDLAKTFGKTA